MKFKRFPKNPIIPRTRGTFFSRYAANPDLLFFKGKYLLYFRGQGEEGHDQIGGAWATTEEFDGATWRFFPNNPVIPIGQGFDSGHILDPAAMVFKNKAYLYYTAHHRDWNNWNIPSHVGLAVSHDGVSFKKRPDNPIIEGAAPEVVIFKNRVHLFFQKRSDQGVFEIHTCSSPDGIHFEKDRVQRVFGPSRTPGQFDSFSVSTVRIWREAPWFYMIYGGCDQYFDYPKALGLARSKDLYLWQRFPDNPIFERGDPGTWDEGALWFGTVYKKEKTYYLWYEGTGAGMGLQTKEAKKASRICREMDYGGYSETSFSQVGLATFQGMMSEWR